jgi:arylformamidase
MSCRSFTHVDATPLLCGWKTIEATGLEKVVGFADVVDLMDTGPNKATDAAKLGPRTTALLPGAKVILRTGWHRHRSFRDRAFWLDSPWLTRDAADVLKARGVATVAYDFPQDYAIRLLLSGAVRPIEEHVTDDVLLRAS